MKFNKKLGLKVIGALMMAVLSSNIYAAELGTQLSNEQRAMLSRLKSKNMQQIKVDDYISNQDKKDEMFDDNTSDCGNVEIGNVKETRPGMKAPEVNVIVTGDIIVAPGECK